MKVKIDNNICVGCELCSSEYALSGCPRVFLLSTIDGKVRVKSQPKTEDEKKRCVRLAIKICPVEAIETIGN